MLQKLQKMMCNSIKLDLVNFNMKFYALVLKILSGNKILTSIKGGNSVTLQKMTGNNPNLDFCQCFSLSAYKIWSIQSICSQDIERKPNSYINQGQ